MAFAVSIGKVPAIQQQRMSQILAHIADAMESEEWGQGLLMLVLAVIPQYVCGARSQAMQKK